MSDDAPKERRSPRGLLINTTGPTYGALRFEQIGPGKCAIKGRGLRLEPIAPNKYAIKGDWPETKESIYNALSTWRQLAGHIKADAGQGAKGVLDRAHAAERVLRQIGRVEAYLKGIEGNLAALLAVHEALLLATDAHQLTVVDNEAGIAKNAVDRKTLKSNNGNQTRRGDAKARIYQQRAEAKWANDSKPGPNAIAKLIAKDIGAERRNAKAALERAKQKGLDTDDPQKALQRIANLSVKADTIRKLIKKPK